jgi:hypothetical protein
VVVVVVVRVVVLILSLTFGHTSRQNRHRRFFRNVAGNVFAPLIVAALVIWNDTMDVIHTLEGGANLRR